MLKKLQRDFSRGKDWYATWRKHITLSSEVKIKNKPLARELEDECNKQGGFLTYAEYLQINQFGAYGYYQRSTLHGKTTIEKRWGNALALYCQKHGCDTVIEFGCGTGDLGVATTKAYNQQTKKFLSWIGIEIDSKIHQQIIDNFKKHNLQNSIEEIMISLDKLKTKQNALFIFPYSLDNIPPHVFLNTHSATSYPNAILGVCIKNGTITEVIIPPDILLKKGIKLENGLLTQNNYTLGLTSWKLRRGQRAYIATDAYATIYNCTKKLKRNTSVIIIDEFRNEPWFFSLKNLGTPKSLYENNLECDDRNRYYHESGKHNFYYPLYIHSLSTFLHTIGFQSITCEIEQKKANQMRGKLWIPLKEKYKSFAFIATARAEKQVQILPITFNPKRLI